MGGTMTPSQAREVVRRGRCAVCGGRLVVLSDEDDRRTVGCFACGREIAAVALATPAPYWQDPAPRR